MGGGGKDSVEIRERGDMALFFVRSIFAGTTFSNGVAGHAICYTPNLFALITGSLANTCGAQMHGVPTRPWRKADWATF